MGLTLTTAPPFYPLTLEEVKAHLRIDADDEDQLVNDYIVDATHRAETETNRQLITATYSLTLSSVSEGALKLQKPPLQSITSITYFDADNEEQTMDTDDYEVCTGVDPGYVFVLSAPSTYDRQDAVTINFTCGYGFAEDVPGPIKRAIKMLCGDFHRNREASTDRTFTALPLGVDWLFTPYRCLEFK